MKYAAGVENLRLKFPGNQSLQFRDLSLSVPKGENILILGPSGCGKSTLLQVLTGIIPNSVEVPIKYDSITIPDSWGYVFQDPDTQFCMPFVDEEIAFVLENLQVPRDQMPALIRKYLNRVGLQLDNTHTNIQTLSQGMKQRLAIASVLALEPDILFLDEPTALLDPEGTNLVWQTIKDAGKGKTLIIVEHKIDQIADIVDRVVLFNDAGEIIADGDRDDIFQQFKQQLIEFGIWYPGVWEDYIVNNKPDRNEHAVCADSMISLKDFTGFRGKECQIAVPQAKVYAKEWIAIVGENGAGKSTLLLALMQLIRTAGSYLLNGVSVDQIKNLSTQLAFVFQNPEFQFVTNTVYDEIAYSLIIDGLNKADIAVKVQDLLLFLGLEDKRDQHPYQLSMGQKRRLSVASAIVRGQRILLLDEPTFGQDARNTFAILEKLEYWREQGTIILMVTHDMDIAQYYATRIWSIHKGQLVHDTKPEHYRAGLNDPLGRLGGVEHADQLPLS